MTLKEMNELLGKSKSNESRLFKQLRALKVKYERKEHHIIAQIVLNEASEEREERIYINPMISYKGLDPDYNKEVVKQMLFETSNIYNKNLEKTSKKNSTISVNLDDLPFWFRQIVNKNI